MTQGVWSMHGVQEDLLAFTSIRSSFDKASPVIGSFPFCSVRQAARKRRLVSSTELLPI
jgi:hypothetical protein